MQALAKAIIVSILGWQVRRLHKKNNFKVVAVAGSLGKTSTKLAIAQVLKTKYKVCYQDGNYNDIVTVPLIFFGQDLPSLFNPIAWLVVLWRNEAQLLKKYPYEVVVVEVGTDGPGQIKKYAQYLKADIGVLTGVAPEHMEFFADLDDVANEELQIANLSNKLIVNTDFVEPKYLKNINQPISTYALKTTASIHLKNIVFDDLFANFDVLENESLLFQAKHEAVAEPMLYAVTAAVAVARELRMSPDEISAGLNNLKPVAGRMQRLAGLNGSVIIDDTYNASPPAMKAALDTLYRIPALQKIAVLGNMNELGTYSLATHREIGELCDPKKLNLLVTIGPDANKFLASVAKSKGCKVESFDDPYSAGEYLKKIVKKDTLILIKGSQNGVFAEETVKMLLADPNDSTKLVRQSAKWLKIKQKAFLG